MLIIYLTVVVFILFLTITLLRWVLLQPVKHKINNLDLLERHLKELKKFFKYGSILVVEHKKTKRFIQFAKHEVKNGNVNICFGYPDALWTQKFYAKVKLICQDAGFHPTERLEQPEKKTNRVKKFLIVEWLNIEQALKLSKSVFKVMELNPHDFYVVYIDGMVE